MKVFKRILGTVAFFGIGILLFCAISYMMRPLDENFFREEIAGFYAEEEESLDIVCTGGSALYYYFNNFLLWEEMNLTSYNFATSSQSNFMIEQMIDEIEKTQSPQLYIVETRKFILAEEKDANSDRFPFVINNMKYSWERIELINHMFEDWQERINYYFDIIMYHDSWEEFTLENLKYINNEKNTAVKGWKNRVRIKNIKLSSVLPTEEVEELPISKDSEQALRSLLAKCKKENIPVLFVSTPFRISKENQQKNAYIGRIIEEAGFTFLDCNQYQEEIGLDGSIDFFDGRHVNMLGAEKTTRFIGNYIQENYQLSTEHSEEVTEEWNKEAAQNRIDAKAKRKEMLGSLEEK